MSCPTNSDINKFQEWPIFWGVSDGISHSGLERLHKNLGLNEMIYWVGNFG